VLQDSKTEVDVADANGWSALHHAAAKGHTTVVQLLLDARAAVNAAAADGRTALHSAACNGHTAVVQLLLNAGADTTATAVSESRTALDLAAAGAHIATVLLLAPLPTVPGPTPESFVLADAAGAAAATGHAEEAIMLFKALMAQDVQATQRKLNSYQPGGLALAAEVLRQWQTAGCTATELEARWPALQQLLVGILATHKQLQAASADLTASAASAALHCPEVGASTQVHD
jgi:hypothetical protein